MDPHIRLELAAANSAYGRGRAPSLAQQLVGNYLKGRTTVHGMRIAIETPRGHYRERWAGDKLLWRNRMAAHYGDISGTRGADGDPVDVFIGPVPESTRVWVINQRKQAPEFSSASGFDEHKVMLGFVDEQSARDAYLNSYQRGWNGLESIVETTADDFKKWLKTGNLRRPFPQSNGNSKMTTHVAWDSNANPSMPLHELVYQLRREPDAELMLDSTCVTDIIEDSDGVVALDALVVPYARMQRKMEQMQAVMGLAASDAVKPVAMQVTEPFRQRGTVNVAAVFELADGQTVSVFFHNPDTTPNKITPTDEMVSWKWLLNKKDITIIVAPEQGKDLNVREVSRRVMRLAEKNSTRFAQANTKRSERMANIAALKDQVVVKNGQLQALQSEIADLQEKVANKPAAPKAEEAAPPYDPNDMDAAASYAAETLRLYEAGDRAEAWSRYKKDPNGGMRPTAGKEVTVTAFVSEMMKLTAGELPEGWTESRPGGMAANNNPVSGGIIDENIKNNPLSPKLGWFVIFNSDQIEKIEGLPTRAKAIEAMQSALAGSQAVGSDDAAALQRVNDVYQFANATEEFKLWLDKEAESSVHKVKYSLDAPYSPLASAANMEEAAKKYGATVEWGFFGASADDNDFGKGNDYVGKVMKDGEFIARIDIGGDGKAMVFVGPSGSQRVQYNGRDVYYSDDDAPLMIDWLFAGLKPAEPVESPAGASAELSPASPDYMGIAKQVSETDAFKKMTRDFLSDLATIKGIDERAKGYAGFDRALFVSSITGKITRLAQKDEQMAGVMLAWLASVVAMDTFKKEPITRRSKVWTLTGFEQYAPYFKGGKFVAGGDSEAAPVSEAPVENSEAGNQDAATLVAIFDGLTKTATRRLTMDRIAGHPQRDAILKVDSNFSSILAALQAAGIVKAS